MTCQTDLPATIPQPTAQVPAWSHAREWFRFGPSSNDHQIAIRTALGIGLPLFTLVLIGRIDLAPFAVFAAFSGIFGRNQPHRQRFATQLTAGLILITFIFAGSITSRLGAGTWGIVLGTTIVAGVGTLAAGFFRLKPAGPLFPIFAFGAISSISHQPPLGQAMLASAATLALTLVISQITRILPSCRTPWTRPTSKKFTEAERKRIWVDAGLYMFAAGAAGSIATRFGIGHNYWAMVAAIVPLAGMNTGHRIGRAVQRVLGTGVGLVLTYAILVIALVPWQMIAVIAVLQFLAEMFIARQYSLAQVFVTPLALMSSELAGVQPANILIQDRALETLIGSLIGITVVAGMHYADQAHKTGVKTIAG